MRRSSSRAREPLTMDGSSRKDDTECPGCTTSGLRTRQLAGSKSARARAAHISALSVSRIIFPHALNEGTETRVQERRGQQQHAEHDERRDALEFGELPYVIQIQ